MLSCGGMLFDAEDTSYGGQLINAAKTLSKTVSSLGETVVSSFTSSQAKNSASFKDSGIVSIVDVHGLINGNVKVKLWADLTETLFLEQRPRSRAFYCA